MPPLDAYGTFLRTADLASWRACLDAYADLIDTPLAHESPTRLAEALCISRYTLWLSSLCGDQGAQARIQHNFRCLIDAVRPLRDQPHSPESRLAVAVAAAAAGYVGTARRLLSGDDVGLEIAVLLLPERQPPAQRAALLKAKLVKSSEPPFLPAVYFYAHALLDLGYPREARQVLDRFKTLPGNALSVDIRGKLCELSGAWADARDVYAASDWVVHRYRRSVCEIILGGQAGGVEGQVIDPGLLEGMLAGSPEIDQAEVVRGTCFVNACRWHAFDNWLVHYELGKLSFQRRRHSEADNHLRAAADTAPRAYLFNVNLLRFLNLTWLVAPSLLRDVPVGPEMLMCARAALEAPGNEELKAQIRNIVASTTDDASVLGPVFDTKDEYEIAEAFSFHRDTPKALEHWCRSINAGYVPRAIGSLVEFFYRAQLDHTANYLVDIVLRESQDDFFVLWEFGERLQGLRAGRAGLVDVGLERRFNLIGDRLEEICQDDFQHLIRAIELFLGSHRNAAAASLLQRAEKLAESAEEWLQLARVRRVMSGGEPDVQGLEHLLRAAREPNDRVLRLQIAGELRQYGQIKEAREILASEGVFTSETRLEPLEYALALQCGSPCLTDAELSNLGSAAKNALGESSRAGRNRRDWKFFVDRLGALGDHLDFALDASMPGEGSPAAAVDSASLALKSDLDKTYKGPITDAEKRVLTELAVGAVGLDDMSLFFLYSLWEQVLNQFSEKLETVRGIRPDIDETQTPIRKSRTPASGVRASELAELWRVYFNADDRERQDAARESIRRFEQQERSLLEHWERRLREETRDAELRLAYLAELAQAILGRIRSKERCSSAWPCFLDVGDYVERDLDALIARLDRQLQAVKPIPSNRVGRNGA